MYLSSRGIIKVTSEPSYFDNIVIFVFLFLLFVTLLVLLKCSHEI